MAKTLVALYDTCTDAERVVQELLEDGFAQHDIHLALDRHKGHTARPAVEWDSAHEGANLGDMLADLGVSHGDVHAYMEGVRRGGALVVVKSSDDQVERGTRVLRRLHPVNMQERTALWRQEGWTGYDATAITSTSASSTAIATRRAQEQTRSTARVVDKRDTRRGREGQSPSHTAEYLAGIGLPAQKEDIIAHAEQHGAGDEVLDVLQELPNNEYKTMADLMRVYKEVSRSGDENGRERQRGNGQASQATIGSHRSKQAREERAHADEEGNSADGNHRAQHAKVGRQNGRQSQGRDKTDSTKGGRGGPSAQPQQKRHSGAQHTRGGKPDINSATLEELEATEGFDHTVAERLLSYREEHGAIRSPDELRQIPGIGERRYEHLISAFRIPRGDDSDKAAESGGRAQHATAGHRSSPQRRGGEDKAKDSGAEDGGSSRGSSRKQPTETGGQGHGHN